MTIPKLGDRVNWTPTPGHLRQTADRTQHPEPWTVVGKMRGEALLLISPVTRRRDAQKARWIELTQVTEVVPQ